MRAICLALLLIGSCSAFRTHIKLKAKDNPVAEVITLLEDLQTQTEDEGAAEAKTYDEFGCFCKDNTKEKSDAIKEDQDEIDKQQHYVKTIFEKSGVQGGLVMKGAAKAKAFPAKKRSTVKKDATPAKSSTLDMFKPASPASASGKK